MGFQWADIIQPGQQALAKTGSTWSSELQHPAADKCGPLMAGWLSTGMGTKLKQALGVDHCGSYTMVVGEDRGTGVRGRGAFDEKCGGGRVKWVGGGVKNLNFGWGYPKNMEKKWAGVGRKKLGGVGGLNPRGRGPDPPPPPPPVLSHMVWETLWGMLAWGFAYTHLKSKLLNIISMA